MLKKVILLITITISYNYFISSFHLLTYTLKILILFIYNLIVVTLRTPYLIQVPITNINSTIKLKYYVIASIKYFLEFFTYRHYCIEYSSKKY